MCQILFQPIGGLRTETAILH